MRLLEDEFKPMPYNSLEDHRQGRKLTKEDVFRKCNLTFVFQDQVVYAAVREFNEDVSYIRMIFSGCGAGECSFAELQQMDARTFDVERE